MMICVFLVMASTGAMGGVPTISDLSDNTIAVGAPETIYDEDITFTGGENYADGFLRFSISQATENDIFSLTGDEDTNASGAISISDGLIYLGYGSGRDAIGIIDETENGQNGKPLKILFYKIIENGGFESGTTSGWAEHRSLYHTNLTGKEIEYSFSDGAITGTGTIVFERVVGISTYSIQIERDTVRSGSYSLRLRNRGGISGPNTRTDQPDGNGSLHGPYVVSSAFTASQGDQLSLDWSAQNGADAYEVFGFLINAADDSRTELFSKRGDVHAWTTTSSTIPLDGSYRFEFVCGSYDKTGKLLTGAELYIDNIRIVKGSGVDDTLLTNVARHVSYVNSRIFYSDITRPIQVDVETNDKNTGSASASLCITRLSGSIPTVSTNNGLTLVEGSTEEITPSVLKATDTDTYDESLDFIITTSTAYGRIERKDNPGTEIQSFTQQDLIDEMIHYVHDGSNVPEDNFEFSVSDGENTLSGQIFSMTMTSVDDMPSLAINAGMAVLEGSTETIRPSVLMAVDEETDDETLVFTLIAAAEHGQLENTDTPGASLTSFTQADLSADKIIYVHDGSQALTDSFEFTVSDGTNLLSGQFFLITVTQGNFWIGESGDWNDSSHWSRGVAPEPNDYVYFELNPDLGDITITVNQDVSIGKISMAPSFEGTVVIGEGHSFTTRDYLQEAGTFDCGQGPVDINGDFIHTGGVFIAPSGSMTVEGDFVNTGGTFDHHSGTVNLDGSNQSLAGDTVFYNLVKEVSQADSLTIGSGTVTTIQGKIDFNGGSTDAPLTLDCSESGSTVMILVEYDSEISNTVPGDCVQLVYKSGSIDPDLPLATLTNTPQSLTNARSYTIQVGGIGVTAYRYKLDEGLFSDEYGIEQPIELTMLSEGNHILSVVGKDNSDAWQLLENPTTHAWTIDITPPVAEIDNCPEGIVGPIDLELMVRGESEAISAYRYRIDGGPWGAAVSSDSPIVLEDLGEGSHILNVAAKDMAENWQDLETPTVKTWTVDLDILRVDLIGVPDAVTTDNDAIITVAGDHVVAYMYRLDEGLWTYGVIEDDITLSDLEDGHHTLSVRGLSEYGDVGDTGDGAVSQSWTVDTTASHAPVLAASSGRPSSTSVNLSWTWSSESGNDSVSRYRVFMSTQAISETTLAHSTELWCDLIPGPEGHVETYAVSGLLPGTLYHFAVKTVDSAGNVSLLSNDAEITTQSNRPEITDLVLAQGGTSADNSQSREILLTGNNFVGSPASNLIRFESGSVVFDIINTTATLTEMVASVPIGAPMGTYDVRVINKNGVSLKDEDAYTVTQATVSVPEVTNVSPMIIPTGTTASLTITGQNFMNSVLSVRIVLNSTVIDAYDIHWVDYTTLRATIAVPGDAVLGNYTVAVENGNGIINTVSSVMVRLVSSVDLETSPGSVDTSGIIQVTAGDVPVTVVLLTDNRYEADAVSSYPLRVTLRINAGSTFEALSGGTWMDFTGPITAPVQVPLSHGVSSALGNYASQFTMGAENPIRLKNGDPMIVTVDVTVPSGAPVPSLYHMADDGVISLAGIAGAEDGVSYTPGGTILTVRENVPEPGMVTYTLGALLNELDSTYALGAEASGEEYGPCFIGSSSMAIQVGPRVLAVFVLVFLGCMISFFKKTSGRRAGVILSLALLLGAGSAIAEESRDETWYILAGGGFQQISESNNAVYFGTNQALKVDNDLYPVLRAGYNITDRIAIEAGFRYDILSGRMEGTQLEGDDYIKGYTLLLGPVYRLKERDSWLIGKWQPFLKGDIGYRKMNNGLAYAVKSYDPAFGCEVAVGMEKGPVDIRFGYAYYKLKQKENVIGFNPAGSSSDLGLSGLFCEVTYRFSFGKHKTDEIKEPETKAPEIKENDSDHDGVPDSQDTCPQTPVGLTVDSKGCPLDEDHDGVPDSLDTCPQTPADLTVDSKGCPLDDDHDGVPDALDTCPQTPVGFKVDSKGCPFDDDNDYVINEVDECPDTPAGIGVDSKGCPADADKDGVSDGRDACPDTPAGVKVDDQGCPVDSDKDGIADYLDQCPDTPEAAIVDPRGCWRLEGVSFDSGRFDIKPDMYGKLDALIIVLAKNPGIKVQIQGYTDDQGNAEMNRILSLNRANAIRDYLVKQGIAKERLTAKGFGKDMPAATNDTPEGRLKNRRVELKPVP